MNTKKIPRSIFFTALLTIAAGLLLLFQNFSPTVDVSPMIKVWELDRQYNEPLAQLILEEQEEEQMISAPPPQSYSNGRNFRYDREDAR